MNDHFGRWKYIFLLEHHNSEAVNLYARNLWHQAETAVSGICWNQSLLGFLFLFLGLAPLPYQLLREFLAHRSPQGLLLGDPTMTQSNIAFWRLSVIFQHWIQQRNILIICTRLKALCSLKAGRSHSWFWYFILFPVEPGNKCSKWAKLVNKWRI